MLALLAVTVAVPAAAAPPESFCVPADSRARIPFECFKPINFTGPPHRGGGGTAAADRGASRRAGRGLKSAADGLPIITVYADAGMGWGTAATDNALAARGYVLGVNCESKRDVCTSAGL